MKTSHSSKFITNEACLLQIKKQANALMSGDLFSIDNLGNFSAEHSLGILYFTISVLMASLIDVSTTYNLIKHHYLANFVTTILQIDHYYKVLINTSIEMKIQDLFFFFIYNHASLVIYQRTRLWKWNKPWHSISVKLTRRVSPVFTFFFAFFF